jgi:hypothetical protein
MQEARQDQASLHSAELAPGHFKTLHCIRILRHRYPTIKWGDPSALEDYQGGRSLKDLQTFAAENLKPVCSPTNIDLCDDEKKAEIKKFQDMPDADLEGAIAAKKKEIETAEETFNTALKELQNTYEKLQKDKDEGVKAVKASGLGLMQAVLASADKKKDEL